MGNGKDNEKHDYQRPRMPGDERFGKKRLDHLQPEPSKVQKEPEAPPAPRPKKEDN